MKKLIMTLLSISLTTTCFAADQAAVLDYLQPSTSQRFTRFTHEDRFAEGIFTTSAAAGAGAGSPPRHPRLARLDLSQFSVGLTNPDYLQDYSQHHEPLKLKTFRKFKNEDGEGVKNILSMRFVERHFPLELSQIIAQYAFGTGSDRPFKVCAKKRLGQLIDGYWKYLSSTVKQHFASSINRTSSIHFLGGVDDGVNGVTEIAKALGKTASLRLEEVRTQHKHLSPATMASRVLTKHINDLAQAYGFRQQLEFNHDWGFEETFIQRMLRTCLEYVDVVLLEPDGFGEDFYRQQSIAYYQSCPIVRQVRLNPNGLPRDVEIEFMWYFIGMYLNSPRQLR